MYKKVLIIGSHSYIGISLQKWLTEQFDKYIVKMCSIRDNKWETDSWAQYDCIVYCAALVHQKDNSFRRMRDFLNVNYYLTRRVADKACMEGVSQFIYLSTNDVFDSSDKNSPYIVIEDSSSLNPKTPYAITKLMAEEYLRQIETEEFKICIIRPPLVYGENCSGNYKRLSRIARHVIAFPETNNLRSMIYIDNLNEFMRLAIDGGITGIYMPQNREYVNTSYLVKEINKINGKSLWLFRIPTWICNLFCRHCNIAAKVFGTFIMEKECYEYFNWDYCLFDFEESIRLTEMEKKR